MPLPGSFKIRRRRAAKGTGNDARDAIGIEKVPGDPADLVKAFRCDDLFMRGDLEYGIDAGIDDRTAASSPAVERIPSLISSADQAMSGCRKAAVNTSTAQNPTANFFKSVKVTMISPPFLENNFKPD
jgi:hypothetical protein